ncbi:hypothetical protein [Pelagicoccus sp. SDUM812003]|uniref:hypothetical protein n=1 Tax=Pelagicoccus sp. SDUM812003 TaxID=3041267 RepID=UPI00280DB936|nr:hypothetical protein [Pelagicoccus sp. SDUM812003]MDQ8202567.1 hypothetical protein [Pelagicoccus sp. SDUM812003]
MTQQHSTRRTLNGKKFLGVRFASCACYGRLYMNDAGTAYVGNCPRCNTPYQVRIGSNGTSSRMFIAQCR